jgi:hypothetical protein
MPGATPESGLSSSFFQNKNLDHIQSKPIASQFVDWKTANQFDYWLVR